MDDKLPKSALNINSSEVEFPVPLIDKGFKVKSLNEDVFIFDE